MGDSWLLELAQGVWLARGNAVGEAHHLPRSRENAGFEVEPGDAQFAVFDAVVGALDVRDPNGGALTKPFLSEGVEGVLVMKPLPCKIGE
jgi:hypothetical protein